MDKIKIGIVEDQKLFRDGVTAILSTDESFQLVLNAENAAQLFDYLEKDNTVPHIIIVDMGLPDINGIEINDIIHKDYPDIKTIILTAYDQPRYIVRLIEKGANSFLSKNTNAEELITAIKSVFYTGFYFNKTIISALHSETGRKKTGLLNLNNIPVELTPRENEVLTLICKEYTTEEIANKLFLSSRTVEGHRTSLLEKTGCKNSAGLVIFAISNNLFSPIR